MKKPIFLHPSAPHQSDRTATGNTTPRIGIALGGGGARGVAHIGVLQALTEAGIPIDLVSGSSVGTLAGSFFAFGIPFGTTFRQAASMSIRKVSSAVVSKKGLFSNKAIGAIIRRHLGKADIRDAEVPLAILATDIASGELVTLKEGPIDRAIRASCCLPGLFHPVEVNGRQLVDGGLADNLGLSPLKEMGADITIAVHLSHHRDYREPRTASDILINAFHIAIDQRSRNLQSYADVLITPDLTKYNEKDPNWADLYFQEGYRAARATLTEIHHLQISRNTSFNFSKSKSSCHEKRHVIRQDRRPAAAS